MKKRTLGSRIYLSMIALILISLVVIGLSTIYFFKNQNDEYHLARLQRKEQSVMLALKYFVVNNQVKTANASLNQKLEELANIHVLDFNLYTEVGQLISTTIKDETKEFLAKDKIGLLILDSVVNTEYPIIVAENLEGQNYLSTYFMLYNQAQQPIAVVNIPYHKDSKRSTDDLYSFLNTLTQVFLLLFVGASLIAYFLSNYITRSLKTVSEGIKHTKLSGENPHIDWDGEDEIGELVEDYNRMVDELQKSADLLAKSERQSAWKEMARQVAHEIKNPLTPMRLNIQHLQRSINDDPSNVQERIDKFSLVMIEQIDTLSRIASEFSNFAKMPRPEMETLSLINTLQSAVDLYENTPNIKLSFTSNIDGSGSIMADRKQIIRALGNLIKNGIQSIPENRLGLIEVILNKDRSNYLVLVRDNGIGIVDEEKSKIFEPYFTTKSGGTGLGLALVRNIFKEINAEVTFESVFEEGTVFTIYIPIGED